MTGFVVQGSQITLSKLLSKIFFILLLHRDSIFTFTFTFMHLADAFIQSDLQCIQVINFFVSTWHVYHDHRRSHATLGLFYV